MTADAPCEAPISAHKRPNIFYQFLCVYSAVNGESGCGCRERHPAPLIWDYLHQTRCCQLIKTPSKREIVIRSFEGVP